MISLQNHRLNFIYQIIQFFVDYRIRERRLIKISCVDIQNAQNFLKKQLKLQMIIRSKQIVRSVLFSNCFTFSNNKLQVFTDEELKSSQKYVEETLRSRSWVIYMLASYIPSPLRPAYYAIHLFDMELTKVTQNTREASLALGKLDFWKESLFKIYNRQKPQPEPLTVCLHDAINNNPLTYGYFTRMISVRAHEVKNRSLSTMEQMRKMADDSKGTIIALTLQLLRIDINNQNMKRVLDYLGQAIGICEYIRRVPFQLRSNRFLLPEEMLTKYNLTTKNIWNRVYGKPSEELFDAVLQIAAYAKRAFDQAVRIYRQNPQDFPQHSFRAFLRGIETQYYLQNLQKYNFNLFDPNLHNLSPITLPYRVYNAAKAKKFSANDPQK